MADYTASFVPLASARRVRAGLIFPLENAHHRILVDNDLNETGCLWLTGDFARRGAGGRQSLGEVGACHDVGPLRIGAGVGYSRSRQALPLGGSEKMDGWHGVGEVDWRVGSSGLVLSATAVRGWFDLDVRRAYLSGASTVIGQGRTKARGTALRARADWLDGVKLANGSISPFVSYTWSHMSADGYIEMGAGFPAVVKPVRDKASEGRIGLASAFDLSDAAALRLSGEWIHRFDRTDAGIAFTITNAGFASGTGAYIVDRDQGRLGADLDFRIGKGALIRLSGHQTLGAQGANDTAGSVGVIFGF